MAIDLSQLLRQGARRHPDRVAVVDLGHPGADRREHTYADLDLGARRVAAALRERGVERGDRVALLAESGAPFVEAWFGVLYAGAALVPIPILSAGPEIAHRVAHAGCRLVLADEARLEVARRGAGRAGGDAAVVPLGDLDADPLDGPVTPEEAQPALVLYTSGTTGKPKGAALSHASMLAHTTVLVHHVLDLHRDDVVLGVLPLTHSYGTRMVMLVTFFAGARCVLMPRFDAARSLAAMHAEGVTWLPAVPTMYAAWAALPDGEPPGLRWCLSAGAPLADELVRRAEARLGAAIRQGYGMTEATFSTLDAPPDARVLGSVGRPVWGVEIRVVDDDERDVPTGERGQVLVRGHHLMSGYLDDPEATAGSLAGGWMHSGDVGVLDGEGRLTVVDRTKDLILRGGYNVYPSEVEDALHEHPAVGEVAVVGRPHDYYGEEVVAVVVPREGQVVDGEALIAWAREQMAKPKVPVEVVIVDRLPLGPSRKVLKRVLRDRLVAGEPLDG